jgi:hypothetical protein
MGLHGGGGVGVVRIIIKENEVHRVSMSFQNYQYSIAKREKERERERERGGEERGGRGRGCQTKPSAAK